MNTSTNLGLIGDDNGSFRTLITESLYVKHDSDFGSITFDSIGTNLIPSIDNTYNIGSNTFRWKDLHAVRSMIPLFSTVSSDITFNPFTNIVKPFTDGAIDFGSSANRWKDIYANRSFISTLATDAFDLIMSPASFLVRPPVTWTYDLGSEDYTWNNFHTLRIYTPTIGTSFVSPADLKLYPSTNVVRPFNNGTMSFGTSAHRWLSGYITLMFTDTIGNDAVGGHLNLFANSGIVKPTTDNATDLGKTDFRWKDIHALKTYLSATTNQLVLGTTNTATINAVAPSASRVYSIQDAGGAANFVMSEGAQTINGVKTFSANIAASTSVTTPLITLNNAAAPRIDITPTGTGLTGSIYYGRYTNDSGTDGWLHISKGMFSFVGDYSNDLGAGTLVKFYRANSSTVPGNVGTAQASTSAPANANLTFEFTQTGIFTSSGSSNQMVFNANNGSFTSTININTPTANRIYTIPDAGADCQFVMAAGTQTISGSKTFSVSTAFTGVSGGITLPTTGGTPATLDFYESTSYTTTFSAGSAPSAVSGSFTINIVRMGVMVLMLIPGISITGGGGSYNNITSDTAMAARFRPANSRVIVVRVHNNGGTANGYGVIQLLSTGVFNIFRTDTSAIIQNWTASTVMGTTDPVQISYIFGV